MIGLFTKIASSGSLLAFVFTANSAMALIAPLTPKFTCVGKNQTLTVALNVNAASIIGTEDLIVGERADERLKKMNADVKTKGMVFYGGLTLYAEPLGYGESYEGNGLEDMEAVLLVPRNLLNSASDGKGTIYLLYTSDEEKLVQEAYNCIRAK